MELSPNPSRAVVVTADPDLLGRVQAVTATLAVELEVLAEPSALRDAWSSAPLVVVGPDVAPEVVALRLPARRGLLLAGRDEAPAETYRCSTQLGAAVLTLPSGAEALAAVLGAHGRRLGSGRLLAVTGASGGVGASTLAAALAVVAARDGTRTALVDLDERGGGLDLLLGAEQVAGWRWPRLAGARGFLGDLRGQLPAVEGVDLLSAARPGPGVPSAAGPVTAVLDSLLRSHALVVVDVGREPTAVTAEALRQADEVLLVVRADVRGVAAGREAARVLGPSCASLRVVARSGRRGGVDPGRVGDALALPCAGSVAYDPRLPDAAELGEPPARASRSPLARSCRLLLAQLAPREAAA